MRLSPLHRRILLAFLTLLVVAGTAVAQSGPVKIAPKTAPKKITVQDPELKRFASTLKDVHVIQVGFQKDFQKAVTKSPLSQKRFMQIYRTERSTHKMPKNLTSAEAKQYQQLVRAVVSMERTAEKNMISTVKKDGFTVSRFDAIVRAVHSDPKLASRLKKLR